MTQTIKQEETSQIATATSKRLQIQPHKGLWVKCVHICCKSNRVLYLLQSEGASHMGPLRPVVTTPKKALTCHAKAND